MRWHLARPALLLVSLIPAYVWAQLSSIPTPSTQTVPMQQCVWHDGDNLAWAAPNFNDSAWQPYAKWTGDAIAPHVWVRCRANLASIRFLAHPALQVHFLGASQVYVNGALAGASGNIESAQFNLGGFYTVPLAPQFLAPAATVALRISYRDVINQGDPAEFMVGDMPALLDHRAAVALSGALGYLPIGLCYALIGIFGFMLLGLYISDRSRADLLLLACTCWCLCVLRISEFCQHALVPVPHVLYSVPVAMGEALELFWICFVFRVAGKRVPWFYWVTTAIAITMVPIILAIGLLPPAVDIWKGLTSAWLSIGLLPDGMLCATAPFFAFRPWKSISASRRAIAFFCMAWGCADFLWFINMEAFALGLENSVGNLHLQKYLLVLRASTTFCSVLALLAIFFREQRRIAQERAQLAGEMASAREIQQYLIPEKLPPTPGLNIRSVYQPSREVGGDFFQILPDARDGSTLLVIGDVAGKGLKAGMLAALIVGAIRTSFKFTSDPASILALLNERLQDRGLVTCLAMRIDRDGNVDLANAGHLPPYIDGRELSLDGALPLGALPDLAFSTFHLQLNAGQSMLFVSDGVVEAQSSTGELFGFDRTRSLSTESAESVALAAQRFGQEDDITVLTVAFAPVEVGAM